MWFSWLTSKLVLRSHTLSARPTNGRESGLATQDCKGTTKYVPTDSNTASFNFLPA